MPKVDIPSKDPEIREILSWLRDRVGPSNVIDHWDGDLCAVAAAIQIHSNSFTFHSGTDLH